MWPEPEITISYIDQRRDREWGGCYHTCDDNTMIKKYICSIVSYIVHSTQISYVSYHMCTAL